MPTVDEVRMRVQRILSSNGTIELRGDEMYVSLGSTVCQIAVSDWGDDNTLVIVGAPILFDVAVTDELYKYVAQNTSKRYFGARGLIEGDDGTAMIVIDQTLLGDTIGEPELMFAVMMVGGAADELDDELQQRFGGKRYADAVE